MKFSKPILFRWLLLLVASAVVLSTAGIGSATNVLTIDGRDEVNLAGDGNQGTFHNPPVNFAFTFGSVAADNPTSGPGDPATAADTDFNFTGTDFGGLGFGLTGGGGGMAFDATMFQADVDLTVNANNTLTSLILNLKDADPPFGGVEEHQYSLTLGGPGRKTLSAMLAMPGFTNNPVNGVVDFLPGFGLNELQLQYPYGLSCQPGGSCTGQVLDVTIHSIQFNMKVPEPGTMALFGLGAVGTCFAAGRRRRMEG